MNRQLIEYTPETETLGTEAFRDEEIPEAEGADTVFTEAEEMELATELLDVQSEQELDQFLGDLIKRAGQAVGTFVRSPTGQALGGVLKSAARKALPIAGRALGGYIGGAGGAQAGARAATAAGRLFGLELEGLSPEDRDFEIAKRFVRFAGETVRAAVTARGAAPPPAIARSAAAQAASRHAPGLLRSPTPRLSGRWFRHGRTIIVPNT